MCGRCDSNRKDFSKKNCHDNSTKYVQGGRCEPGDGSKCSPWNSLALAEADITWKKLIVLSSPFALDGGITLRNGTTLEGCQDPLSGPLSPDQPTITNTSVATNGGNGVVVESGDVCIKNIHFNNTWASAILYDNAVNLTMKNVLVTGHNQGELSLPFPHSPIIGPSERLRYFVAGVQGTVSNNGKTLLNKVKISNNHVGNGVNEFVIGGANRSVRILESEFTALGLNVVPPSDVESRVRGVLIVAAGVGSQVDAKICSGNFHDYLESSLADVHSGFVGYTVDGGKGEFLVAKSKISNISTDDSFAFGILTFAHTNPAVVIPFVRSEFKLVVKKSIFEGPMNFGILYETANGVGSLIVTDNTFVDVNDNLVSFTGGDSQLTSTITGNNGSGNDGFVVVVSNPDVYGNPPNNFQTLTINNNTFTAETFAPIQVIPIDEVWTSLSLDIFNNCFDGLGSSFGGLVGLSFGGDAGNATLNAHQNNIVGYAFDIYEDGTNMTYAAQNNWWGSVAGPQNITNPPGIAVAIPFLVAPISCPAVKYCASSPELLAELQLPTISASNVREYKAKLLKLREK